MGKQFYFDTLTRSYAEEHADVLLRMHNTIPYVHWSTSELLASEGPRGAYLNKWRLSRVVLDSHGDEPVGFLIAYERAAHSVFATPSIYLHRAAIARALRGQGVGRALFESYISSQAAELAPHLKWITLQTNLETRNMWLIDFYKRLGFQVLAQVPYPDKLDVLMGYHRF